VEANVSHTIFPVVVAVFSSIFVDDGRFQVDCQWHYGQEPAK
jgi:hypothetical protein